MTFAFISEAWGPGTNELKKKKKIATCDSYKKMQKEPEVSKQAVLDQDQTYDVYPSDLYEKNVQFVDYDDFYKSDFQYASKMEEDQTPAEETYHAPPPPLPAQQQQQPPYADRHNVYENFAHSASGNCNLAKEQLYLEFMLYMVCGIFMILILEQVLQLGTKFVH
jgi:hypothetical protein